MPAILQEVVGGSGFFCDCNLKKNFLDINIPEFSWSQIRTAYNTHADEVYGNPTDLTSTIFAEDADAFFEWCDSNGDGEVSLWESASCGAKAGFWQPEGKMKRHKQNTFFQKDI